jgi:mannosylglucosylglycerate synthase
MSSIGLCHYKVGATDGVSLEMDKWKIVLEKLGHVVHLCAGNLGSLDGFAIEELHNHRDDIERINRNAFFSLNDYGSEEELENDILGLAERIEDQLRTFIETFSIDLLIPNNIWSIGLNLPAAVGLARVVRDLGIPVVAHHHDFYWESFRQMKPTCKVVRRLAQEYLPPKDKLITHVVINSLAQIELRKRSSLESIIIPNVFDFSGAPWGVDSYNRGFRDSIGVGRNDILVLQATRIVERKGIELAIALVKQLNKPSNMARLRDSGLYDGRDFDRERQVVFVLAGSPEAGSPEDRTDGYLDRLQHMAKQTGIETRFIGESIRSRRAEERGHRLYSLWDCYVFADLVTYPSLFEGWGNQFLEAIWARLPVAIFEYPVYRADIKPRGFDVISLGDKAKYEPKSGLVSVDQSIVHRAAKQAVEVLASPSTRLAMVDHNFTLGKRHYSLEKLERYINDIIDKRQ